MPDREQLELFLAPTQRGELWQTSRDVCAILSLSVTTWLMTGLLSIPNLASVLRCGCTNIILYCKRVIIYSQFWLEVVKYERKTVNFN